MSERFCCDGKCLQRNPSQGGHCPADRRKKAEPDHFWILYLLCFMVGLLGCSVVTFFGDWQ